MKKLFSDFPPTIQTEFVNFGQWAQTQELIHIGSPGSIEERIKGSSTYYYLRFYDANAKLSEKYFGGPKGTPDGELAYKNALDSIERSTMVVRDVKMFRKLDFAVIEDKAGATLAALHNYGLFAAGLTLIGSNAYGAILNNLGVKAQRYLTEDIDTARSRPLSLATEPQLSLLDILKTSGLPFVRAKTGLNPKDKSETYRLPGNAKLLIDLSVSGSEAGAPVSVPELDAYAQSIPHLNHLVENRMSAVILSKNYVVPIFVPSPERFATHKLFSAVSRVNQAAKSAKDLLQAATVICAVEEKYPGDMADALSDFPKGGRRMMLKGAEKALHLVCGHSEEIGDRLKNAIQSLKS
jgi:hypothetical protein